MNKKKLLLFMLFLFGLMMITSPKMTQAWPDEEGNIYVMDVGGRNITADGIISDGEWDTEEEVFLDTFGQTLNFGERSATGVEIRTVILTDGEFLYVRVDWENYITDASSNNSIGLAFANQKIQGMQSTWDRKVAFWDATNQNMNNTDLWGCQNIDPQMCAENELYAQPGIPDSETEFQAHFGVDERAFFEFQIPLNPTNSSEDIAINLAKGEGTHMKIVVNPYDNIAAPEVGHGGLGSSELIFQDEPRCFICRPGPGMPDSAKIFNIFFAVLVSGIFLSFIVSGRSKSIAEKMWKIDVTEDQAKESVVMEIAYYNSSFISLMTAFMFTIYAAIAFGYGFWAQWGVEGAVINGIPLLLGIIAMVDLIMRNENPQETKEERPGVSVEDSDTFWIVPTAFLGLTLLMLVFIGIDVIA